MLRRYILTIQQLQEYGTDSFHLFVVIDDNNTYVSRMVGIIQTNGDYDKLVQGMKND